MAVKFAAFADGVCDIFRIGNIAEPGDRPRDGLIFLRRVRFDYRSDGVQRKLIALQYNNRLSKVILAPFMPDVRPAKFAAVIDGEQYKIIDTDLKHDAKPRAMLLSLETIEKPYEVSS
jgi:hypothetical protein